MHRWFYANEREDCVEEKEIEELSDGKLATDEILEIKTPIIPTTLWPFCVMYKGTLLGNEHIAITGNCDALGNWQPAEAILLLNDGEDTNKYQMDIEIPRDQDIEYRYVIVALNPYNQNIIVRFWETNKNTRRIRKCDNMLRDCDVFGWREDEGFDVERAYVTSETYVQFKVHNAPFLWPSGLRKRELYTKITPMFPVDEPLCQDYEEEDLKRFQMNSKQSMKQSMIGPPEFCTKENMCTEFAFAEVVTLSNKNDHVLKEQTEWGARSGAEDLLLFHLTIGNMTFTRYRVDLFTYAYKAATDEPPYHFGYGYILPHHLVGSEGSICIKITCASTHRPLSRMKLDYLIIRPVPNVLLTLKQTYKRRWPRNKLHYDIGRRGCGQTYQLGDNLVRENTLCSFNRAAAHGADMIGIDVMLSNEGFPVVYQDHTLRLVHKPCAPIEELIKEHDIMVFPMLNFKLKELRNIAGYNTRVESRIAFQNLKYNQLRKLKAFRFTASETGELNCERMLHEQLPFPLLSDVIERTSMSVGLLIEVKWVQKDDSQRWHDGGFKPSFDRNYYVDQVLQLVLNNAELDSREVILASNDLDICAMLRFKQNRLPVMLITLDPECPVQFGDPRVNDFYRAVFAAHAFQLYGVIVHINQLLQNPTKVCYIKDHDLIAFAYGQPMNDAAVREKIGQFGIKGAIFDRIDQLNQAGVPTKPQFFMIETPFNKSIFIHLLVKEMREKCGYQSTSELALERRLLQYQSKTPAKWMFCVYTERQYLLHGNAYFAISGNCDVLGNWNPKEALTMERAPNNAKLWIAEVEIPRNIVVQYRYFIYVRDPINDPSLMHLRYWEAHVQPRKILTDQKRCRQAERFGVGHQPGQRGQHGIRIDRTWLMSNETFVYFKLFNSPFYCIPTCGLSLTQTFYVRVTRLVTRERESVHEMPCICNDFEFVEVSNMANANKFQFADQPRYGVRCGPSDLVMFRVTVSNMELTIYRFDIFTGSGLNFAHFGYTYLFPERLQNSNGTLDLFIFSPVERDLVMPCLLSLSYLLVKPLPGADERLTMERTYERYWNARGRNLRIGNRGCGPSYYFEDRFIRENTIYSYDRAYAAGADMVQLDVQLTGDSIPIVHHDTVLRLAVELTLPLKHIWYEHDVYVFPQQNFTIKELYTMADGNVFNNQMHIPLHAFTHEQLKRCRAYHFDTPADTDISCKQLLREQMPFAALEEVFMHTSPEVGFLINVVYTQKLTNKFYESAGFGPKFDRNEYIDEILKVVMPLANGRRIIFSSYDCDICIMLRNKQNLYPVLLTTKSSTCSVSYEDPRLHFLRHTVLTARAIELLGLNMHVDTIVKNEQMISYMNERNMTSFCWGEPANKRKVRSQMIELGVMGAVFDRIDQLEQLGTKIKTTTYIYETDEIKEEMQKIRSDELKGKCEIRPERRPTTTLSKCANV